MRRDPESPRGSQVNQSGSHVRPMTMNVRGKKSCVLDIGSTPDTMLGTSCALPPFTRSMAFRGRDHDYSHFTEEDAEAQLTQFTIYEKQSPNGRRTW